MISKRWFVIAPAVAVLIACRGEEEAAVKETSTVADYMHGLEAAQLRVLEHNYDDPSDGELTSEDGLAYMNDIQQMMRDHVADLEALNPPDEVAAGHDRFLEASRSALQYTNDFLARAADAQSDQEKTALNAEFFETPESIELNEEFTAACTNLQRQADAQAIDVRLNCRGEVDEQDIIDELLQAAPGQATEPACDGYDVCFCEISSCPEEVRVSLNGIPGRILLESPPRPSHLIDVSVYIEFDPGSADLSNSEIRLPLPTDEESEDELGFYSYMDGRWQREADVTLIYDRRVAKGRFESLPPNLMVLREVR